MNFIFKETFEKNGVKVIVDNNGMLWLNEKHIEKGLGHANLQVITKKYNSDCRKHRYQLVDDPKKTRKQKFFLHKDLALKVILDCKTTDSCKFKRKLGLNLLYASNFKQQTVLGAIKDAFEGENMQTEYSVLGYIVDLYFHDYKLSKEVDEFGYSDRNIDYEIQR